MLDHLELGRRAGPALAAFVAQARQILGAGGNRPNCRKVAPIARTLGGRCENGLVPVLSGNHPNIYVYTTVRRYCPCERTVRWTSKLKSVLMYLRTHLCRSSSHKNNIIKT